MEDFTPVRFEDGRPMLLGGLRRRHGFAGAGEGIAAQWRDFFAAAPLPGRVGETLYGVMCGGDATGLEYMCAVEVESLAALPPEAGRMRVPPQRYAVFAHPAGAPLPAAWMRILGWLETGPYASAHLPDFERYAPGADPRAESAALEIWVGVVPRAQRRASAVACARGGRYPYAGVPASRFHGVPFIHPPIIRRRSCSREASRRVRPE